jgi:hypothetical protein
MVERASRTLVLERKNLPTVLSTSSSRSRAGILRPLGDAARGPRMRLSEA